MISFDFMECTVEPKEVLSLSSLFLRWPYKTAQRVSFEVHKYFEENLIRSELTIYHLEDVLYQQNYVGEYQYKGFLLRLKSLLIKKDHFFENVMDDYCNYFVLKSDVIRIEKRKREYCTLPAGHKKLLKNEICSMNNLNVMIPRILCSVASGEPDSQSADIAHKQQIHADCIWPWLGPVMPEIAEDIKRTITDDKEEMAFFVDAARVLGQQDSKCLARMLKFRYPNVPHTLLVELIDPECAGEPASKRKRARRWLGLSE